MGVCRADVRRGFVLSFKVRLLQTVQRCFRLRSLLRSQHLSVMKQRLDILMNQSFESLVVNGLLARI